MATFDNPTTDTAGTVEDDTFTFDRTVGTNGGNANAAVTVSGNAGRDTLLFTSTAQGEYTISIGAGGQLSGSFRMLFNDTLRFSEFEVVRATGTSASERFLLYVEGAVNPADLRLDGGNGGTNLTISQRTDAALTFNVSEGVATSSVGIFTNFDSYILGLGRGDDVVHTGGGNDRIGVASSVGPQGYDQVYAEGGDDRVTVYAIGHFDGGDGHDTLRMTSSPTGVDFRLGVAADGTITSNQGTYISFERFELTLGSGNDGVITGAGDDVLRGGAGDDYLQSGAGNDVLRGDEGTNTLIGGLGDDTYRIDFGADTIVEAAGEGYDTVQTSRSYALPYGSNIEALVAIGAFLTLTGNELDNTIIGSYAHDTLIGGVGADILDGSGGTDAVSYAGDAGAVFVNLTLGQGYTNTSFGDTYSNIENVVGTSFADFIIGNETVNRLDGGAGDDIIIGALDADLIIGGAGSDWASYEDNSGTVFVNLTLNQGSNNAAEGDFYEDIENLVGGLFDDFFIGDDGANLLSGAMGADTLLGAGGADVFMFTYAPGATSAYGSPNVDLILDFATGEDTIELAAAAFAGLTAGALPAGAFNLGAAAADADDRIIYDGATGKLWFDPDGSGSQTAMLFATFGEISHPAALAATDFVVV